MHPVSGTGIRTHNLVDVRLLPKNKTRAPFKVPINILGTSLLATFAKNDEAH